MHIAMWSGPRNLSTAMMYSFAARNDFKVMDEPFYGAYLKQSGENHPMGDAIMASMECDAKVVPDQFTASGDKHLYTKQMTHHMLPGIPRPWFGAAKHAFLIRHPARVVASYAAKRERPTLNDLGFLQQAEILKTVQDLGLSTVVIDSFDVRRDPEDCLRKLCDALGVAWDTSMLSWPKGPNKADGVWADHWYGAVHGSTGFAKPEGELPQLEPDLAAIADAAMPFYEDMAAFKI